MSKEIRIYVACLAAYNSGCLHGVWVDAMQELADIQEQVSNMLEASPVEMAEEYAIHDYEGFESIRLSEWESLDGTHKIACFIEEHGNLGAEVLSYCGNDLEEAQTMLDERYSGCYESIADYAQELTESTSAPPSYLEYYIDYERMGRGMELGGYIVSIEMGEQECHIFYGH